jgi:hypothetical protein
MDDAMILEPFSKSEDGNGRVQGKNAIESFLTVAMMASAGLREEVEIEKPKLRRGNDINQVTAYVTFERGGKLQAKFTFKFRRELQFAFSRFKFIIDMVLLLQLEQC